MSLQIDDLRIFLEKTGIPARGLRLTYHSSSLFPLYLVETDQTRFALKGVQSRAMALAEAEGLTKLRGFGARTPLVHGTLEAAGSHWLLMDFIKTGSGNRHAGRQDLIGGLSRLYSNQCDSWGESSQNFIGTIPQTNHLHPAITERKDNVRPFESFWWEDRILPVLDRSRKRGLLRDVEDRQLRDSLGRWIERFDLDAEMPRPIHGDLWSGNILFADREAYLIDPSFARSWPEQDFAMLELFGSPLEPADYRQISDIAGFTLRGQPAIEFFQLYPYLVHAAIFGGSYEGQTRRLIKTINGR